jgi:hypothetical protein
LQILAAKCLQVGFARRQAGISTALADGCEQREIPDNVNINCNNSESE